MSTAQLPSPNASATGDDVRTWRSASLLGHPFGAAWSNRPLRLGVLWGLAAFVILMALFKVWLHRHAEGVSHRAFLPSVYFGIPEREAEVGMRPVAKVGYDGQMYYWMSNDVFGRYDEHEHFDEVLYRYQRIGIPMLAAGLATLMGFELTPPFLYHTLQFAITCAGFGAMVYWLVKKQLHPVYALGWLVSAGTLQSLWLGILDAPADAIFVFAVLAVLAGRLWWYAPLATLLLLTREGYAVYAFAVFLITLGSHITWVGKDNQTRQLIRFSWRDASGFWRTAALTAVPGIVMLAWTAYLAIHFQQSPMDARSNPDMTNWPYYMMWRYVGVMYDRGDWFELRLLLTSAFTLVLVSVLLLKNFRRLPVALAAALPYVLLTAALGKMVWEAYGGHTKASGSIILLGLFLMPIDKSMLLRFMLILQAIVGVDLQFGQRFVHGRLLSAHLIHEEVGYPPNAPDVPDNPVLSDLRSTVRWVDAKPVVRCEYRGIWMPLQRELRPITVAVTNHTDATWQPGNGRNPIYLAYVLFNDGRREIARHKVVLDKAIGPGETKEITTYLDLWRPNRSYTVEFSLFQEGPGWFALADPSFGRTYEFRVE